METRRVEEGVEVKINLMFLVSKFMANYSYKFEEVLKLNWFVFNDLLDCLRGVRIEKETTELIQEKYKIILSRSQNEDSSTKINDIKKDEMKKYVNYDTSERDIKEMEEAILGRKRG